MRDRYPEITKRFKRETADHQMTVLYDDGLYRHVRFCGPKHSFYWFDLVTWPGNLVFRGDGETYAFSREEDMFGFFRHGAAYGINPSYWGEKITDGRDRIKDYSEEEFTRFVAEYLIEAEPEYPGVTKAWADFLDEEFNTEHEDEARRALDEFRYGAAFVATCVCGETRDFAEDYEASLWRRSHQSLGGQHVVTTGKGNPFRFYDTWEWDLKDYHWWFLWACTAIVWGIGQYDAARQQQDGGTSDER